MASSWDYTSRSEAMIKDLLSVFDAIHLQALENPKISLRDEWSNESNEKEFLNN